MQTKRFGLNLTACAAACVTVVIAVGAAHAALYNRGTDAIGNRLIYDSGRNITWYDYTHSTSDSNTWGNHLNWASALAVSLRGTIYDDWRLPTIAIMEDPRAYSYTGLTTYGYNISTSEMGHLFYTELGNKGYISPAGNEGQPGWGLTNTGDFQNLQSLSYYSETEDGPWTATYLSFNTGEQYVCAKLALGGTGIVAMAVRSGDVVTEPASLGDTNGDGVVDVTDFNNVQNNFGATGNPVLGDTNNDGVVDVTDYNNVQNNFGAVAGASLAMGGEVGSVVPEPASLGLLSIGSLMMLGFRGRCRRA